MRYGCPHKHLGRLEECETCLDGFAMYGPTGSAYTPVRLRPKPPVHLDPRPAKKRLPPKDHKDERVACGRLWWRVTSTGDETKVTCRDCLRDLVWGSVSRRSGRRASGCRSS